MNLHKVWGANIRKITPEELLGRKLNEFEKKYAPKILYIAGSMRTPLPEPRVAVIGTRKPSSEGIKAALKITKVLIDNKVIVLSGLAKGIDTIAHKTAIEHGGKTIAVLGTPLNKFYPAENRPLQELIMKEHLAISQYPIGHITKPKHFVLRNRTMALISNASIIVEAGESSGVISQGWETLRLGRPLFFWKSLVEKDFEWVKEMMKYGACVLKNVNDLKRAIREMMPPPTEFPISELKVVDISSFQ
ncbi:MULTISPECIES: DNA-processing protein DprA [unclassified Archaeoglobus]|jgi:DNA processing protein|uniref:DNA-processing protein DprA n=1 Tax=unclassified Archaeoglobus TaxID=2643606 RepID=UPI0025C60515|nr:MULTISPECIES: DNA-processing protein DprA [unclassified Archaeoglobus]